MIYLYSKYDWFCEWQAEKGYWEKTGRTEEKRKRERRGERYVEHNNIKIKRKQKRKNTKEETRERETGEVRERTPFGLALGYKERVESTPNIILYMVFLKMLKK